MNIDDQSSLIKLMAQHQAISRTNSDKGIQNHMVPQGHDGFNSLWSGDAIMHWMFWSTLALVMACCQTAPKHCLNQFWLTINWMLRNKCQRNIKQNKNIWECCLQNDSHYASMHYIHLPQLFHKELLSSARQNLLLVVSISPKILQFFCVRTSQCGECTPFRQWL